jgi:NAD(P)-dependent dehydrogenase (short-subunit alcohol dehydrogenase family)
MVVVLWSGQTSNGVGGRSVHGKTTSYQVLSFRQALSRKPPLLYNTTKAALVMFSKNLANELIPHRIRVNALNLGLVLTPDWIKTATQLTEGTGRTWQDYIQEVADQHAPIKRFAAPEEVASFFVFLCSERATYSVGSTYYVDGGMLRTIA